MITMQVDLNKQFEMQKVVDNLIHKNHDIADPFEVKEEYILAIMDEICELMNKMRIHKFWSNKEMEAREVLLEEYVDIWHFLLAIGNMIQVPVEHYGIEIKPTFTQQFRGLLYVANDIFTPMGWHLFANQLKGLGIMMGFGEVEVIDAFKAKHDINIKRQQNGY
jgi:dimeric dUTPase (all-alpha-NTP-PPase superfamily)